MQSQGSVAQPRGDFADAFDISDAFGHAIEQVKRVPGVAFLGGFLTMCTEGNNADIPDFSEGLDDPALLVAAVVSSIFFVIGVIQFFLAPFVEAGFIRTQRQILDEQMPEPSELFTGGTFYVRLLSWNFCWLGATLLAFLPTFVSFFWALNVFDSDTSQDLDGFMTFGIVAGINALIALPLLIIAWLGLCLTSRIVVLEDMPLFEAARASWNLTRGRRLSLVLFALVGFLFKFGGSLLGIMLCCVGVFVVYPIAIGITELAWTRGYLWFVHGDHAQRAEELADVFR